jgi:Arc/MetJ-type ribon-helix-helix transcriptional regulator
MSYQLPPDLYAAVQSHVASGQFATEDDVVRSALAALNRHTAEVRAIQEGLDDMEAGRFRPLEQADAELREKYGFAQDV